MQLFRFSTTAVLSLLMAGALGAQTPPQTPPRPDERPAPRAPQPAAQADAAEMTIVGCLAQSKTDSDDYVLTVIPAGAAQAAGAGTTKPDATRATTPGTTPSDAARTAAGSTPAMYKIVGIDDDQLKPHVNHQIELKGRVSGSPTSAPSTTGGATAQAAAPKEFRASSVKMVSATCPAAK